jgi:hypothetical protein
MSSGVLITVKLGRLEEGGYIPMLLMSDSDSDESSAESSDNSALSPVSGGTKENKTSPSATL